MALKKSTPGDSVRIEKPSFEINAIQKRGQKAGIFERF